MNNSTVTVLGSLPPSANAVKKEKNLDRGSELV